MTFLLDPLVRAIGHHVRAGVAVHADDTPVPVLDPGRGKTKTGRLWVVVRDERPWGSLVPPAAFYRYSADRKAEHALALLSSCRGFLHADAGACPRAREAGPGGRLQRALHRRSDDPGAASGRGRVLGARQA